MIDFIKAFSLLFVLLNPFLLVIYLIDIIQKLKIKTFGKILFRAGLIATTVFCAFAILGDAIFSNIVQVDFASFQIFGGLVFLFIGYQFVFKGPGAIEILRGESEHLSGAIAMPILIGPGTISACVVIGKRLDPLFACIAIAIATISSIVIILLLKLLHDYVLPRSESLVQRYIEVAGRITALFVGTFSIEMVMNGIRSWIGKF